MKIYLVGGAVRDELLGLRVKERDWVVVGGTRDALINGGFKQVGADFPVFLHPKTHEEYALARTERKTGSGYYGFTCDASIAVTLEEDLARRDLTINAMAKDEQGEIIDPFHGRDDLRDKCLRHVSLAFVEDPVRVLRIARFAARYHYLGFTVAEETLLLMRQMVNSGELSHLVAERVWQEWQKSLSEKSPWVFWDVLKACGAIPVLLPELMSYSALEQRAALLPSPVTRFAVTLLKVSAPDIDLICKRLRIPHEYRYLANLCAIFSDKIAKLDSLTAEDIVFVFEKMDAFRRTAPFYDALVVLQADERWKILFEMCKNITVASLNLKETGVAIRAALHRHRVLLVISTLTQWNQNEK